MEETLENKSAWPHDRMVDGPNRQIGRVLSVIFYMEPKSIEIT
jgi:hypothetical protein